MNACMSASGQKQTYAAHNGMSALHPIADMCGAATNVRYGPKADSCSAAKFHFYSITSSARASSDGGTVRPSALAVLRLITSSNLVGCSTGRSDGLAPSRFSTGYQSSRCQLSAVTIGHLSLIRAPVLAPPETSSLRGAMRYEDHRSQRRVLRS